MLSTRIIDPALSAVRRSASASRISRQMGMRILLDLKQPRVPRHGRCHVMGDLAGVGVTQVDQKVALDAASWDGRHDKEARAAIEVRSEEHTSELQSLMRISYAV